jgi:hypothetical protein
MDVDIEECPFDAAAKPIIQEALWLGGVVADCQSIVLEYFQCLPRKEASENDDAAFEDDGPMHVTSICGCNSEKPGRRYEIWRHVYGQGGGIDTLVLETAESDGKTVLEPIEYQTEGTVDLKCVTKKWFRLVIWHQFNHFNLGCEFCVRDSDDDVRSHSIEGGFDLLERIQAMLAADGISVETIQEPQET